MLGGRQEQAKVNFDALLRALGKSAHKITGYGCQAMDHAAAMLLGTFTEALQARKPHIESYPFDTPALIQLIQFREVLHHGLTLSIQWVGTIEGAVDLPLLAAVKSESRHLAPNEGVLLRRMMTLIALLRT